MKAGTVPEERLKIQHFFVGRRKGAKRFMGRGLQLIRLENSDNVLNCRINSLFSRFSRSFAHFCLWYGISPSVLPASVTILKFIEEQPQILRLTTPELKYVRDPVRSE
jgi:hypothetical protein